ncbi:MAG TPA: hypothetical protein VF657_08225 [Actinoplanes sp.]
MRLSISSTILIYVLIPAVAVGIIAALSMAGSSSGRRSRRYRPGRPYDFTPIWYLASPDQVNHPAIEGPAAGGRPQAPAIESGVVETGARVPAGAVGGASDSW